jgi:hypothetical protein
MIPDIQQRIALLRSKIADGTITLEEMKEGVAYLREGRLAAAQASASSKRKRAIAEIPKASDMLDELDELE